VQGERLAPERFAEAQDTQPLMTAKTAPGLPAHAFVSVSTDAIQQPHEIHANLTLFDLTLFDLSNDVLSLTGLVANRRDLAVHQHFLRAPS
jgi:hypothetical protein